MAVRSASDAWGSGRIDVAKVEATTEAEIRAHMIEDGDNPDAPFRDYSMVPRQDVEREPASKVAKKLRHGFGKSKFTRGRKFAKVKAPVPPRKTA